MNLKKIFENYTPRPLDVDHDSAVLLLLMPQEDGYHLVFERRSSAVMQAGDSSFIGGHLEHGETPLEGALREAKEEAGLDPEDLIVHHELDFMITLSGLLVHVFLAELKKPGLEQLIPNEEVETFFSIPLSVLMEQEPETYPDEVRLVRAENFPYSHLPGGRTYPFWVGKHFTYFYHYQGHVVWGMTAAMVRRFVEIIKSSQEKTLDS